MGSDETPSGAVGGRYGSRRHFAGDFAANLLNGRYILGRDQVLLGVLQADSWRRPLCFAWTVSDLPPSRLTPGSAVVAEIDRLGKPGDR